MAIDKPIIVVVHATSKQGTSVVISLLHTDAKQLAANGAELVEADASDEGQLRAAFEGAYGVFAMTVRLGGGGLDGAYEREFNSGKTMADAAAAAGVKVFVFNTLEDADKRSKGKYSLPHFASKAHVMDYVEETHGDMIGIYPAVAAFYTNVIHYAPPRLGPDGVLTFSMPIPRDYRLQWLNPYSAPGPVVAAAFLEPEKYSSIFIPVYDEVLTCDQMVKTFTEVTGIKARYRELSKEDLIGAGMSEPAADLQIQMYTCSIEFGFYSPDRDLELVHRINPHPETWADFLTKTGFDGTQKLDDLRRHYV